MSEMSKKHDGSRTARALKVSWVVSLVAALALWASPVVAGPPPGSTAVTFYMCVHNGSFLRSVMVSGVERGQVVPNEYNFFSFNSDDRTVSYSSKPLPQYWPTYTKTPVYRVVSFGRRNQ